MTHANDDLVKRIRALTSPLAEGMADGERLTALIHAANEAADRLSAHGEPVAWMIPPGWKLVPVDITEEMWDAFFKARDEVFPELQAAARSAGQGWKGLPAVIWEELLSAAPTSRTALSQVKEGSHG